MPLVVDNLSFDYPDYNFDFCKERLLNNINFNLEEGDVLHLLGNNGSGKTTLLKIISGLLHPHEGDIRYFNKSIFNHLSTYQENICYLGHKLGISLELTVWENCQFDLKYLHCNLDIDDLLKRFSLFAQKNTACFLLSAGLRRRVALLRLLMSKAKIWLLDEPFVALDNDTIAILKEFLRAHVNDGGIVIYTSHQLLDLQLDRQREYLL